MDIPTKHRRASVSALWVCLLPLWLGVASCHNGQGEGANRKGSSGKTLEMLFVADRDIYTGSTAKLVDSLFASPQEGLNRIEPMFDVVNMPLTSFQNTEMFRVHRNVVLCDIKPDNPNKVYQYTDRFSSPQAMFDIAASDRQALDSLLLRFAPTIRQAFYHAEHRRIEKAFRTGITNYDILRTLEKRFGFGLYVSNEYVLSVLEGDFAWIRKETKDYSLCLLVERQPYVNETQFDEPVILDHLDTLLRHHVPGPADGSYAGTERRDFFYRQTTKIDGQYAVEERGLWRCFGDFMGGPFVSYTILSPDRRELVTLFAFVYSPRKPQRDLLMQVEGVCHSLSFVDSE